LVTAAAEHARQQIQPIDPSEAPEGLQGRIAEWVTVLLGRGPR
jgi:hypothetical protein